MPKLVTLLNGPNLNLLGLRQPELYGRETLDDVVARTADLAEELGLTVRALQSNHEGQLVDWIHEARGSSAAIIINPGAYSHTSIAILDALKMLSIPIVECHLSNPAAREAFRRETYVSLAATGLVSGFGAASYELAVEAAAGLARSAK